MRKLTRAYIERRIEISKAGFKRAAGKDFDPFNGTAQLDLVPSSLIAEAAGAYACIRELEHLLGQD